MIFLAYRKPKQQYAHALNVCLAFVEGENERQAMKAARNPHVLGWESKEDYAKTIYIRQCSTSAEPFYL